MAKHKFKETKLHDYYLQLKNASEKKNQKGTFKCQQVVDNELSICNPVILISLPLIKLHNRPSVLREQSKAIGPPRHSLPLTRTTASTHRQRVNCNSNSNLNPLLLILFGKCCSPEENNPTWVPEKQPIARGSLPSQPADDQY